MNWMMLRLKDTSVVPLAVASCVIAMLLAALDTTEVGSSAENLRTNLNAFAAGLDEPRDDTESTNTGSVKTGAFKAGAVKTGVTADGKAKKTETAIRETGQPYPVDLKVWPSRISLTSGIDRQSMVAQLVFSNQATVDVTNQIQASPKDSIVKFENGYWQPLANGETKLNLSHGEFKKTIPVSVSDYEKIPGVSFINDVMPVFSKTGCNAGSCHGAARGKDGFQLSLYGFDALGDYQRLTRELPGRRVDLAVPEDCLLMAKATGAVPHSGGELMTKDSEYYQTLLQWLETGAKYDAAAPPQVTSIELFPDSAVLRGKGSEQTLSVIAHYADGTDRDVTSLAYFSTNRDNVAAVSQTGQVKAGDRGEAFVMSRFDTHTVGRRFIVLPDQDQFQWQDVQPANYVDDAIYEKLKRLRIQPSEICSDSEFIRRAYLDICGLLPTAEEVQDFVADSSPDKRSECIDRLLDREEFTEMWVMKWSELLQVRSTRLVSYKATLYYYDWLKTKLSNNVPIDQMVRELLGATGGTMSTPEANFYHAEPDNKKMSENVAQVFLGMRIQCAQCHNHPFDRWTMDDYYGFNAFFAQVGRKVSDDPREQIIYNRRNGEAKHPVTNKNVKPKFLGGIEPEIAREADRRAIVAEWITSPENPYFAKNLANIVWAHFLGQGIIDEVDDVRVSNPPVNEQLLDRLAAKLIESKYDFKDLVRDICNSNTYQMSTQPNDSNRADLTNFSHASYRRIRAEVLLDAISQVTETKNKFRGLPLGARAVEIADGNTSNYFLKTFGRSSRETVCSCEVKMEPSLSQALHLLNGDTVHRKIIAGKVIEKLVGQKLSDRDILNRLYLTCLARQPTAEEIEVLVAQIKLEENRKLALEDVFWAILNSREFVFNH